MEPEKQDGFVETKKKGVMKKIGGEPRPTEVVTSAEAFPELGSAPVKVEKKEEPKVEPPQQSSSGPRRFVNNKKTDAGPNFVPIKKVEENIPAPAPVTQTQPQEKKEHVPVFQRGGGPKEETPAPENTEDEEGKIKFSAGPKKFVSSKVVKPREEEKKSELDV